MLSDVCAESSESCEGSCSGTWCEDDEPPNEVAATCSTSTCGDLGWTYLMKLNGAEDVCGGNPNAGGCDGLVSWKDGRDLCEAQGARLCSVQELLSNEARGVGCGYDSQLVWSSTPCSLNDGTTSGYESTHGAQIGSRTGSTWCLDPEYVTTMLRCCADAEPCPPTLTPSAAPHRSSTPTFTPTFATSLRAVNTDNSSDSSGDGGSSSDASSVSIQNPGDLLEDDVDSQDGEKQGRGPSSASVGFLAGGIALLLAGTAAASLTATCRRGASSSSQSKAARRHEASLPDGGDDDKGGPSPAFFTDEDCETAGAAADTADTKVHVFGHERSSHSSSSSSHSHNRSNRKRSNPMFHEGAGEETRLEEQEVVFRGASVDRAPSPTNATETPPSSPPEVLSSMVKNEERFADGAQQPAGVVRVRLRRHPVAAFLEEAGLGKFLPAMEQALKPPPSVESQSSPIGGGSGAEKGVLPTEAAAAAAAATVDVEEHVYGVAVWDPEMVGDLRLVTEFGLSKKDVKRFRVALHEYAATLTQKASPRKLKSPPSRSPSWGVAGDGHPGDDDDDEFHNRDPMRRRDKQQPPPRSVPMSQDLLESGKGGGHHKTPSPVSSNQKQQPGTPPSPSSSSTRTSETTSSWSSDSMRTSESDDSSLNSSGSRSPSFGGGGGSGRQSGLSSRKGLVGGGLGGGTGGPVVASELPSSPGPPPPPTPPSSLSQEHRVETRPKRASGNRQATL